MGIFDATTLAALLGGIGLFILGMRMMTEGLKLAAGDALRSILQSWTRSAFRGLLAGILITAVVQSSSAVTVATVGFVNAGLLTLTQAVWVIFGTNLGTTMTGWLVALVGIKVDVAALALPMLGAGMLVRLAARASVRRAGFGEALAGFGAFFLGVSVLQEGFTNLAPHVVNLQLPQESWLTMLAFVLLGMMLTVLTQSSSAAIAIALTASAGGAIPLELAAAAVIGTNIGTTSTAYLASLGATAPARRVASAHIAFNFLTGIVALALLPILLGLSTAAVGLLVDEPASAATLAAFHTIFNGLGVILIWPFGPRLVRYLSTLFVLPGEEIGRPLHLDSTLAAVPAVALRGIVLELVRMMNIAFDQARLSIGAQVPNRYAADQRRSGLMNLGQAIRDFIGEVSIRPLSNDVVEAVPDLIRTIQHLEDLTTLAGQLQQHSAMPLTGVQHASEQELKDAVVDILERPNVDMSDLPDPELITDRRARVEATYQDMKAQLLRAAALGKMPVARMESELLHIRQMRLVADAAVKAQRRLLPWAGRVGAANVHQGPSPCPN